MPYDITPQTVGGVVLPAPNYLLLGIKLLVLLSFLFVLHKSRGLLSRLIAPITPKPAI